MISLNAYTSEVRIGNMWWRKIFTPQIWCSTLLWPFVDENPFNLNNPSISRETAMTRADEIRKMIE